MFARNGKTLLMKLMKLKTSRKKYVLPPLHLFCEYAYNETGVMWINPGPEAWEVTIHESTVSLSKIPGYLLEF